jgi:hypothetical protein
MSPWPLIATGGVMIEVFLVIGLLWLLVLTVAFAGIVRHLAAMQVAGVGSAGVPVSAPSMRRADEEALDGSN